MFKLGKEKLNTSKALPVFRWAGSKRKLLPTINRLLPTDIRRYIEPFCGSACLFFSREWPSGSILNDINGELINAYRQIRQTPIKIYNEASNIRPDESTYYRIREEFNYNPPAFERAVYFVYLNRYGFNGVYRTNLAGQYNVPFGSKTGSFPDRERFSLVAKRLKNTQLSCQNFLLCDFDYKEGDFLYLDPPYSSNLTRNRGEYWPNSFTGDEIDPLIHKLKTLDAIGVKFIFSYRYAESVLRLIPPEWRMHDLFVTRSISGFSQHRSLAQELLVMNY